MRARRAGRWVALGVAVVLASTLASCVGYASTPATYGAPRYPEATSHPTDAEQAATLQATEGYRRFLLTHAERLTQELWQLDNAASGGQLGAARRDEVDAQVDFDAFRGDLATDSATAVELDGEAWSVGAGRLGGLHAIERDLFARDDAPAAGALAAGLVDTSVEAAYSFSRAVLSPAQILAQAQAQLEWAVAVAIPGREEQFSHLDLVDVDAACRDATVALALTAPLGRLVAPAATLEASARLAVLARALSALGDPAGRPDGTVPLAAWRSIASSIDAADGPLGTLSGDVEGFGSGRLYA